MIPLQSIGDCIKLIFVLVAVLLAVFIGGMAVIG